MTSAARRRPKVRQIRDRVLGQRIRVARLSQAMSQTKLAKGLGITSQKVQKYEYGVNRVSPGRLSQIAELTGQPISYFLGDGNPKLRRSDELNAGLNFIETAGAVRLVRAFAAIENAATRRKIVELAEAVVKRSSSGS